MNRILSILTLVLFASYVHATELPLMPYPQHLEFAEGQGVTLSLDKPLQVAIVADKPKPVRASLERFIARIEKQTGKKIRWKKAKEQAAQLVIRVKDTSPIANHIAAWDESYSLKISSTQIELTAAQQLGALRGLETLLQLLGTGKIEVQLPQVTINDSPRFKWRGLLLDTSRHFFSVETIKRQLDTMAAAKYNIFHWHLTDDQGWRLESKTFPKLQQLASDGQYYSHKQIREVVAYARERGIQVLPEIDIPGHASAIAVAYPELMSAPGPYAMETRWGVHKPTLNPANEKVYEFVDGLIAELVALFPFEYIHIGGDEVDPEHWNTNPAIQSFMQQHALKNHHDLQAHFNLRVQTILQQHKRKMIGWDEIQHPDLPKNIVIQSWQGPDGVSDAVSHGFQSILSTGYYLDQPQTSAYHYRNDPIPSRPYVVIPPQANEPWQSWYFEMPRKRGKPVAGVFTLLGEGKSARGFVDFSGKSRRDVNIESLTKTSARFALDTWMGPVIFDVNVTGESLQGFAWVGNVAYTLSGKQVAGNGHAQKKLPEAKVVAAIERDHESLILGGEAALWAEIVDEQSIDLRLWPRAFVVAERLWSARDLQDETSLYDRLETTMDWARKSTGVQDLQQHEQALQKLAGDQNIKPLQLLAEALEPAHYYHRQHEKSAYETYSRTDRLDRLVDALPAENRVGQELLQLATDWGNTRDKTTEKALRNQFSRWLENDAELQALLGSRAELKSLQKNADKVKALSALAIQSLDVCASGSHLSKTQLQAVNKLFDPSQQMDQEMVISLLPAVKKMVHIATGCS